MFHFCCLYNQLFSVLIFHGRNNPVYMLCWRSSGICCTIHPVSPQYLKWICVKWCQSGAEPGGCWGEQEPAHVAQRFPGVSQVHPSSKDTSSVLCNSQLFCSEPWQSLGRCLLCSLNAAFSQGRAGSGEWDFFFLSLGHGIPDNWHFVPGRAIHPSPSPDSNQAKRRRSSLWRPFCWKGLGVAFGFNYPVSFSACLSFDCTGWAGCVFPWNKVLHPSWESAGRPQEQ